MQKQPFEPTAPPTYYGTQYEQPPNYPPSQYPQPVYPVNQSNIGFNVPQQQSYPVYPSYPGAAQPSQPDVVVISAPDSTLPTGVKHAETFMAFSDRSIKMAFIRKVYALLTLQLLLTFGFIALFCFVQPIKAFCVANWWMILVSAGVMLGCMILMCFVIAARRSFPLNLILLFIFTVCESFAVATITTYFSVNEVLLAFGVTMIIAIGISLFTLQTRWDFSACSVISFLLVIFLVGYGVLCGLYYGCGWYWHCIPSYVDSNGNYHAGYCYYSSFWYIFLCGFGALIFSVYLVFDTMWMVGGKHKYGLSPEEYIFAALNLYLDIINIFLYILMLFGAGGGGRR